MFGFMGDLVSNVECCWRLIHDLFFRRLDLVQGAGAPAFRHRDVDYHCSQASGCLFGGFSARFPWALRSRVTTRAPSPGPGLCRGGRCTFERDVPPHSGILVWGQPRGAVRPPQAGPLGPDNGEASRGLVWACCGGTHPQVSQIEVTIKSNFSNHAHVFDDITIHYSLGRNINNYFYYLFKHLYKHVYSRSCNQHHVIFKSCYYKKNQSV